MTGIDDHSRFCVIAKVVARATARPVCDALLEALNTPRHPRADPDRQRQGVHRQARPQARQRAVRPHLSQQRDPPPPHRTLFADDDRQDRASAQDDAKGVLLGQRLRARSKTCRRLSMHWVVDYNNEREHQSLGDVPPIRRFELARPPSLEVIDGDVEVDAGAATATEDRRSARRPDRTHQRRETPLSRRPSPRRRDGHGGVVGRTAARHPQRCRRGDPRPPAPRSRTTTRWTVAPQHARARRNRPRATRCCASSTSTAR